MRGVSEQPSADVTVPPAGKRPEWLVRGIIEAGLILVGLLGGFALNEWQQARERRARADTVLSAIRSELAANLALMDAATKYNSEMVARFRTLREAGATEAPLGTYRQGLFSNPALTSAAWTSAEAGGVVNDLPMTTVLALARAYETQRIYTTAVGELINMLFASRINSPAAADATVDPQRITGILSDYAGRGQNLVRRYRDALKILDATPRAVGKTR
jgi:hypothetical protein